tara:strand:- start:3819 stop:6437 length:2619 start_codon:yes stop_codon:yes gene_type:complete
MIVLKDDFFRILSEKQNEETDQLDVEVKLTIYYNIFAIPFGYDNLEIYFHNNGDKDNVKFISLYEKLNSREQEIINYISGMIKHSEEVGRLNGDTEGNSARDEFLRAAFSAEDTIDPISGVTARKISSKFPEINIFDKTAYLYSNSYYENFDEATGDNQRQKIPLSSDYKKITDLNSKAYDPDEEGKYTSFQKACHRLVSQKKDPLQPFMKADFIKSDNGRNEISKLSQDEINLFVAFMRATKIETRSLIDNNGMLKSYDSDVSLVNCYSNLKKITTTLTYEGFEMEAIEDLRVSLSKKESSNEVIEIVATAESIREQKGISKISRVDNLGNFPVSLPQAYRQSDESLVNDIAIEKSQYDNPNIYVYSNCRTISYNEFISSGFNFYDLKSANRTNLMTTVDLPSIADNMLKRDIITNTRTGEIKVNSTIKPCKTLNHYSRDSSEQQLANIKIFVATVSRDDLQHFPKNVIKISGMNSEFKISKVICEPMNSGTKFKIPVMNSRIPEIQHLDPVAGAKYRYKIYFTHIDGTSSPEPFIKIHRTLPRGKRGYNLTYNGVVDNAYISLSLDSSLFTDVASGIQDGLRKAFPTEEAANFYKKFFEEKINENLKNIADILQIQVTSYYKSSGNYSKQMFFDPFRGEEDLDRTSEFRIPIENLGGQIVQYNLMISNPLDIINNGLETVTDEKTREVFLRRTAAFFNNFTTTTGILPVITVDPVTGRTLYSRDSKLSPKDPFNNVTCIGGIAEVGKNLEDIEENKLKITNLNSLYVPDDGECVISWMCEPIEANAFQQNKHADFFVITASINDLEVPLTSHPFIDFTHEYKVRTFSLLGAASHVKFNVYIVYADYTIEKMQDSTFTDIKDIRKSTQEII